MGASVVPCTECLGLVEARARFSAALGSGVAAGVGAVVLAEGVPSVKSPELASEAGLAPSPPSDAAGGAYLGGLSYSESLATWVWNCRSHNHCKRRKL